VRVGPCGLKVFCLDLPSKLLDVWKHFTSMQAPQSSIQIVVLTIWLRRAGIVHREGGSFLYRESLSV
jgi:hypothetical protein